MSDRNEKPTFADLQGQIIALNKAFVCIVAVLADKNPQILESIIRMIPSGIIAPDMGLIDKTGPARQRALNDIVEDLRKLR